MNSERLQRVEDLFRSALKRQPHERAAFLDEACGQDLDLRREVESLLAYQPKAETFMETPVAGMAAAVLADDGPDDMPAARQVTGQTFGPYVVKAYIGSGGMGEVYLAEDSRLGRKVALKVLSPAISNDSKFRARFLQEAQSVSSLNHPHICTLHDVGQQDGIDFLVMEYLEGETLAERLNRGPLPLDEAMRYGMEIADAMDKAHRQGITHRDLKPANIMLTKSGAKLLDFGVVKIRSKDSEPATLTSGGMILGTPQYMAPEQLEGRNIDGRTDIFAFGAVLFEMLTGRKAFEGASQSAVIAAIMHVDPPVISSLQPATPRAIDRLVRTCLVKDPDERWQTAHDLTLQLRAIAEDHSQYSVSSAAPAVRETRRRRAMSWALPILLLVALTVSLTWRFRNTEPVQPVRRFLVPTPIINTGFHFQVSPDGRKLAFVGSASGGANMLYIRPLDSVSAQRLPGTEGALAPFWSADSRYIGFSQNGKLMKTEATGGSPQALCDLQGGPGSWAHASWNSDDVILFGATNTFHTIPAAGGVSTPVTTLDKSREETGHFFPYFLPDGRHYLYLAWSDRQENRAIFVGSLDSEEKTLLMRSESMAAYAASGHLLFVDGYRLLSRPFDAKRLQWTGEAVPLADEIQVAFPRQGLAAFSVSSKAENNVLVYRVQPQTVQLDWIDRAGRPIKTVGVPPGRYAGLDLSPDGSRLALHQHQGAGGDVQVIELSSDRVERLTFDPSQENSNPIWSPPDGKTIAYGSRRNDKWGIYQKPSDGSGEEERLFEDDLVKAPMSWSKDGKYILYWAQQDAKAITGGDVWALRLADRTATPLLNTPFWETSPQMSPDGKLFAYSSNEEGPFQVYVRSFPRGGKVRVSRDIGLFPRWSFDGKELFFMNKPVGGDLMSSEIRVSGSRLEATPPRSLFSTTFPNFLDLPPAWNAFAVSNDGQSFLIPQNPLIANPGVIVVLNWTADLKK